MSLQRVPVTRALGMRPRLRRRLYTAVILFRPETRPRPATSTSSATNLCVQSCGSLSQSWKMPSNAGGIGELARVPVTPGWHLGRRSTELLHELSLDDLPPVEDIVVDNSLVGQNEQGQSICCRTTAIKNGVVKIDANHPLAGETLSLRWRFGRHGAPLPQ